jgi:hypothetical protein
MARAGSCRWLSSMSSEERLCININVMFLGRLALLADD